MATFLICHGAWSAGWAWKKVRPLLRAAGHEVFTPTYTGVGERAHQASPDVDLDTHIQDVLGVIEFEGLSDITLMGHSYGGMVITGVADRVLQKIKQMIYLDAFVPENGQSVASLRSGPRPASPPASSGQEFRPGLAAAAQSTAAGYLAGRSCLDHAVAPAAAGQDVHAAAGARESAAEGAAQLHLLHQEGRGRPVRAVRQTAQVRSRLAHLRDGRQPQPQCHRARGARQALVRDRRLRRGSQAKSYQAP